MITSKFVILAFTLPILFINNATAETNRVVGLASVVDGDTIIVDGSKARVRLYGVDAPESSQTCKSADGIRYHCGGEAAQHLADLIGRSGRVICLEEDRDCYGRIVAECSTLKGIVLNAEMVKAGWAIEYRRYSDGRYDREEAEARAAKRGLWAGTFVEPSEWRKNDRSTSQSQHIAANSNPPADCPIKGNISGSSRIYHSPGQENYEKTRIDTAKGERWFCSAAEAQSAGWRPAKR